MPLDTSTVQGWLVTKYNEYIKKGGFREINIFASPKLYDDYESSLIALTRLVDVNIEAERKGQIEERWLALKSAKMIKDVNLQCDGWAAYFEEIT